MNSLRDEISCYLMTLGVGLPDVTDKHAQCILSLVVKRLEGLKQYKRDFDESVGENWILFDDAIAALKGDV